MHVALATKRHRRQGHKLGPKRLQQNIEKCGTLRATSITKNKEKHKLSTVDGIKNQSTSGETFIVFSHLVIPLHPLVSYWKCTPTPPDFFGYPALSINIEPGVGGEGARG